ncbi:MAG: hypothetical protein M1837_000288 [Sclerophora amabilis]|nr:MAG: hypothetical protein M1837_000288 [Sclerophora amabilis]
MEYARESLWELVQGGKDTTQTLNLCSHTTREQTDLAILPSKLPWYTWWLRQQTERIPPSISEKVVHIVGFDKTFSETAKRAQSDQTVSIDDIVRHLITQNIIQIDRNDGGWEAAQNLVFGIIGWQTMLYAPSFGTCPPQHLAICDDLDGFTGQAYMTLKQDRVHATSCLPDFLLGFGLMLPKENAYLGEDLEEKKDFDSVSTIHSGELNIYLLRSIGRVNIKWVDVLAPHMEYDIATNTVFLFRYPSFCAASLTCTGDIDPTGVIHCCATHCPTDDNWASKDEVSQFLREVLLSYRLLFGQSKMSRNMFRTLHPFCNVKREGHDHLLARLCGRKRVEDDFTHIVERDSYRLNRDFPILRSKIVVLHRQLSNMKPRGLRQLWRDTRDSVQWFTFWAVLVIGGLGVVLSVIQVGLQAAQLAGVNQ